MPVCCLCTPRLYTHSPLKKEACSRVPPHPAQRLAPLPTPPLSVITVLGRGVAAISGRRLATGCRPVQEERQKAEDRSNVWELFLSVLITLSLKRSSFILFLSGYWRHASNKHCCMWLLQGLGGQIRQAGGGTWLFWSPMGTGAEEIQPVPSITLTPALPGILSLVGVTFSHFWMTCHEHLQSTVYSKSILYC